MNPGLASSVFNMLKVYVAGDILGPQIAKLWGKLFNRHDDSGLISSCDTSFYVDHDEPLDALLWLRESVERPLGELWDCHKFILIIQASCRSRSRSRSAG
jgi:hypothetical protein